MVDLFNKISAGLSQIFQNQQTTEEVSISTLKKTVDKIVEDIKSKSFHSVKVFAKETDIDELKDILNEACDAFNDSIKNLNEKQKKAKLEKLQSGLKNLNKRSILEFLSDLFNWFSMNANEFKNEQRMRIASKLEKIRVTDKKTAQILSNAESKIKPSEGTLMYDTYSRTLPFKVDKEALKKSIEEETTNKERGPYRGEIEIKTQDNNVLLTIDNQDKKAVTNSVSQFIKENISTAVKDPAQLDQIAQHVITNLDELENFKTQTIDYLLADIALKHMGQAFQSYKANSKPNDEFHKCFNRNTECSPQEQKAIKKLYKDIANWPIEQTSTDAFTGPDSTNCQKYFLYLKSINKDFAKNAKLSMTFDLNTKKFTGAKLKFDAPKINLAKFNFVDTAQDIVKVEKIEPETHNANINFGFEVDQNKQINTSLDSKTMMAPYFKCTIDKAVVKDWEHFIEKEEEENNIGDNKKAVDDTKIV